MQDVRFVYVYIREGEYVHVYKDTCPHETAKISYVRAVLKDTLHFDEPLMANRILKYCRTILIFDFVLSAS